jgi:hypothetical protein
MPVAPVARQVKRRHSSKPSKASFPQSNERQGGFRSTDNRIAMLDFNAAKLRIPAAHRKQQKAGEEQTNGFQRSRSEWMPCG